MNERVQAALRSKAPISDDQEVIQQFFYDLYKYEYLVLINQEKRKDYP